LAVQNKQLEESVPKHQIQAKKVWIFKL
jgi:hypothetical protein